MTAPSDITAVILAGGFGTRLREITQDRCPKPMVPVPVAGGAAPFLEFVLAHFAREGVRDVILCIGHLGAQIVRHFGDGSQFGLHIRYDDAGDADTGARVASAARMLEREDMLVACGDVYFPLDLAAFLDGFAAHPGWLAGLAGVADAPADSANMVLDGAGRVVAHGDIAGVPGRRALETGVLALRKPALAEGHSGPEFSLTHHLFPALVRQGRIGGMIAEAPFFDIGTPDGYHRFCAFAAGGHAAPVARRGDA